MQTAPRMHGIDANCPLTSAEVVLAELPKKMSQPRRPLPRSRNSPKIETILFLTNGSKMSMKILRIYRRPDCAKCAKIAKLHRVFDWRKRLDISTATPPTGPLRMGETVVENLIDGTFLRGAAALAAVCREVPAYPPMGWIFKWPLIGPALARYVDREMSGVGASK